MRVKSTYPTWRGAGWTDGTMSARGQCGSRGPPHVGHSRGHSESVSAKADDQLFFTAKEAGEGAPAVDAAVAAAQPPKGRKARARAKTLMREQLLQPNPNVKAFGSRMRAGDSNGPLPAAVQPRPRPPAHLSGAQGDPSPCPYRMRSCGPSGRGPSRRPSRSATAA